MHNYLLRNGDGIVIGFSQQHFPMEDKYVGKEKNSIGIFQKDGIYIDGNYIKFKNVDGSFKEGDFVGLGIIHQANCKLECFATYNGKLLGKI